MFRIISTYETGGPQDLFKRHPATLAALLETAWAFRMQDEDPDASQPFGSVQRPSPALPDGVLNQVGFVKASRPQLDRKVVWHHLIYAYMIENTRIFEVFERVLSQAVTSEKLSVPSAEGQLWLRSTEELFFRPAPPFSVYATESRVRPDLRATRRNAYYRMFGMDLNHGDAENRPYPYPKPSASNTDFTNTFEDFLREVWIGIKNDGNTSGAKETDDATIANLARQLHDMLKDRRQNGNLSREEFNAVATMSWFHLTVDFDSPIVKDLRAEGSSPDQRLRKVAERVGIPAHGRAEDFFRIAEPISELLIQIEHGTYNDEAAVPALYTRPSPVQRVMSDIITHWSIATGRSMKARRVQQAA